MTSKKAMTELRRFQRKSGWSQGQIAKAMGLHLQTVGGWFREKYQPSILAVRVIEDFLKRRTK